MAYNKDTQARIDALNQQNKLQNNLTAGLKGLIDAQTGSAKVAQEIADKMELQTDVSAKLNTILDEKQKIIEGEYELNEMQTKLMLKKLEYAEELAKKEIERKEVADEIKNIGTDFGSGLGQSVGLSKELSDALMTASAAAIGLVILKEVADYIASSVTAMKNLTKETGASWKQAMQVQGAIKGAHLSINPLKYSYEEVAASAEALRDATGQIVPDPSLLADITEVNALLSNPTMATSLTRTLKNAGIDAGELTEEIQRYASSVGQDAGPAMEYLAANQLQLNGMSKEQIKLKAKEAIEMKKMGVDMQKMVDLASEQLDIESSLKNEMKLRTMLGKDISFNELRAAQASGDAFAVAQAQKKLIDQLGPSLEGNLQVQRMISEATGLTNDEMLNIKNATNEATTAGEEMGDAPKETLSNLGKIVTVLGLIAAGGLVVYGILLAMGKVKLPFTGGGKKGNPIANFVGGFGTTDVLKGAAAMLLVAASLAVLGFGLQQFMGLSWEALAMAGVAMIGLLGVLTLLGMFMMSGIGAVALLAGAAALLVVASSLLVLGYAIQAIATGFEMLGNISEQISTLATLTPQFLMIGLGLTGLSGLLATASIGLMYAAPGFLMFGLAMIPFSTGLLILSNGLSKLGENIGSLQSLASVTPMLAQLVGLIPGLIALSGAFYLLSGSLISLSLGLSTIGLLLPVLSALGTLLPTVSAAFGGDGGESAKESSGGGVSMKEVVEEIKGLRSDIQAQPIMINVDGRVVSEITKVQSRKLSTRKSGYGG